MSNEISLIRRFLKTRSEKDFLPLYDLCNDSLYRMSLYLSRKDIDLAYDWLQETWSTGLMKLSDFKGQSELKTWLTGILINISRNHYRKIKPDVALDEVSLKGFDDSQLHFSRMDLEFALMSIPNGYREVLLLHDLEGYTHEEIGGLLGIASGTSKSQLSRARKAMRKVIKEYNYETSK